MGIEFLVVLEVGSRICSESRFLLGEILGKYWRRCLLRTSGRIEVGFCTVLC